MPYLPTHPAHELKDGVYTCDDGNYLFFYRWFIRQGLGRAFETKFHSGPHGLFASLSRRGLDTGNEAPFVSRFQAPTAKRSEKAVGTRMTKSLKL